MKKNNQGWETGRMCPQLEIVFLWIGWLFSYYFVHLIVCVREKNSDRLYSMRTTGSNTGRMEKNNISSQNIFSLRVSQVDFQFGGGKETRRDHLPSEWNNFKCSGRPVPFFFVWTLYCLYQVDKRFTLCLFYTANSLDPWQTQCATAHLTDTNLTQWNCL